MAFNVSLTAQVAGRAAPLAFAIGTVAMIIVGLSFVGFTRRIAHAGSAYAYDGHTFGRRCGFIAGWTLLLTYLAYAAGVSALVGNFLQAAVQNCGLDLASLWVVIGVGAIVLATYRAYRDMGIAAWLMLALEGLSVLAILLSGLIVAKVALGQPDCLPRPLSRRRNLADGLVLATAWSSPSCLSPGLRVPRRSARR
jgi:amino acid transporter